MNDHPMNPALLKNQVHKRHGWTRLLRFCLPAFALAGGLAASAQTITTTTNFVVGRTVPDGSASGLASATNVSTPVVYVTDVNVSVKISGTFNGDLYCYLTHSSGHSVLLNRPGRRSGSNLGYSDDGISVTFDDAASNGDVHIYRFTLNS